jgi:DNA-binding response OmpR family regulator
MTLSSMVVSRDWQEVSVLECILGGLHMDVAVEQEPERALTRLSKSKVDALIVDCDLNGTNHFLRELQRDERQVNTVPLVITGGSQSRINLDATGALFAFEKPISVEQAVRTLSAARNLILDGRLRYHREGIAVPVILRASRRGLVEGQLVNVSQGGLQIQTNDNDVVATSQPLRVSFELPGAKRAMKAHAEIVWQDQRGNVGIRFVKVAPQMRRSLRLWLAQQYFAN